LKKENRVLKDVNNKLNFNLSQLLKLVNNVEQKSLVILEHDFKSYINVFTRTSLNSNHSCLDHIFHKNIYNKNANINA